MGRLASLGDQIERDFGRKNQLAVLFLIKLKVKENFFIKIKIIFYMMNPERFEPKFERLPEKIEKGVEEEKRVETMNVPEIVVQPEKGTHLLSIILKGHNPEWGNCDSELAKLTEQHFSEHPLNTDIKNTIEKLTKEGVDEESLYNLSLTYQNPERAGYVFDMLEKHKGIRRMGAEESQRKLVGVLEILDKDPSLDGLKKKFTKETQKDIATRQEQLGGSRQKIEKLIDFFRPKLKTTEIERVNLLPTDFLYHKRSGKSFSLGKELILMSSPEDSIEGQAHEFLHGVINPIVDKLEKNLSEDHKRKIIELTSGKIKQHYGEENYYSHLCEGFIRTHLNVFEKGEKPQTYKNFRELISQKITNDSQFQEIFTKDKELKQRCDALGISNLKELIQKSKDYFETYEEDKLGNIINDFLGDYKRECSDKPEITFEDFVLQKFVRCLGGTAEKSV